VRGGAVPPSSHRRRRRRRGRRARGPSFAIAFALLAITGLSLGLKAGGEATDPARPAGVVRIVRDSEVVAERRVDALRRGRSLDAWLARVPSGRVARRGTARVRLRTRRTRLRRSVRRAVLAGGDSVTLPERAVSAQTFLPAVRQRLRNNCETAALSMLLVGARVRVGQLALQRDLPRSAPLDPRPVAGGLDVWGDPSQGFVGRADGGGAAGGYGVYARPIQGLATRRGVRLRDLSGRPANAVYRSVLEGRPVMAWVGLSDGPYKSWRTPRGKRVTGNFGEHTVVVTGVRADQVLVNDPLVGRRSVWPKSAFELMWERLGRRALAL
jgi:uncharacterized protein YvpB